MNQNETKVSLELTINQLNVVLAAVAKLPIEAGLDAFTAIQQQAQQQLGTPTAQTPPGPLADKVIQ
jgi:hypothetical protein